MNGIVVLLSLPLLLVFGFAQLPAEKKIKGIKLTRMKVPPPFSGGISLSPTSARSFFPP